MREERGQVQGNVIVDELYTLWGSIAGNVHVMEGGKLYLRGSVYGDVVVEWGGRVHIYGNVQGNLTVNRGAKVIHSGVIGGDVTNNGGRIFIERVSKIAGKTTTKKGDTMVEPPPRSVKELEG